MAKDLDMTSAFTQDGFTRKGNKEGGIHKAEGDTGTYKKDEDIYLIKRDFKKPENDIAEYLSAAIFGTTAPGSGCEIGLTRDSNGQAYLTSKFYKDNYQDLFQELGEKERSANKEMRQYFIGRQYVKEGLKTKKEGSRDEYKYGKYSKIMVSSALIGDFSTHSGNIGAIGKKGERNLVRIDFGAALRKITADIKPYKSMKNRLGLEKNYFLRDHPKERVFSADFSKELKRVAAVNLDGTIDNAFQQIGEFYRREDVIAFGMRSGLKQEDFEGKDDKNCVDLVREATKKRMAERSRSLKDLATEVDLKILIDNTKDKPDLEKSLKKLADENPEHFTKLANNPGHSEFKIKIPSKVSKQMQAIVKANKQELISNLEHSSKTKAIAEFIKYKDKPTPFLDKIANKFGVETISMKIRRETMAAKQNAAIMALQDLKKNNKLSPKVISNLEEIITESKVGIKQETLNETKNLAHTHAPLLQSDDSKTQKPSKTPKKQLPREKPNLPQDNIPETPPKTDGHKRTEPKKPSKMSHLEKKYRHGKKHQPKGRGKPTVANHKHAKGR